MWRRTTEDDYQFLNHKYGKITSTTREVIFHVGVDYFDRLPDDVVIQILERLNLKDAAKTSILSRRFLELWKLLIPYIKNLDFLGIPTKSKKFKEFMNGVMGGHKGPSVDSLTITTSELHESFNDWIAFARNKCVKNLEIEVIDFSDAGKRFSIGWDKLTSLTLRWVWVTKEELEEVLKKGLRNLESLSLGHASFLKTLEVSSRSLKRLEFSDCHNLRHVDINFAPNLQFYRRMHRNIWTTHELCIKGAAPKLSHVCIDAPFSQDQLSHLHNTGVEKLELYLHHYVEPQTPGWMRDESCPRLGNLKELKLTFEILSWGHIFSVILSFVLPACPRLQKLSLDYYHTYPTEFYYSTSFDWGVREMAQLLARSRVHECLKVVEFRGWKGSEIEVETANLVKQIAPNLEKITYG